MSELSNDMRLKLDRRIHNQRVALRENWQIVEMRANFRNRWHKQPRLLEAALRSERAKRDAQAALTTVLFLLLAGGPDV